MSIQWKVGDLCCYWWKNKKTGIEVHIPCRITHINQWGSGITRITVKPLDGRCHRTTIAANLEPRHEAS